MDKHRQRQENTNDTSKLTVHYRLTRKDKLFMSLRSLYAVVSLLIFVGIFYKIDEIFSLNTPVHTFIDLVSQSALLLLLCISGLTFISFCSALLLSHITLHNYQVATDEQYLYISERCEKEGHIKIRRDKILNIVIEKPITRQMFQLVTIKLHYKQTTTSGESIQNITLIPSVEEQHSKQLIEEILPDYTIQKPISLLASEAYFVELIQPSYLLVIVTFLMMFFLPELWFIPALQAVYLIVKRVLKTNRQQCSWNNDVIAIRTGSFSVVLFVIKREDIEMVQIHQSWIQRKLRLATCQLTIQNKSIQLEHVTETVVKQLADWFVKEVIN